MERRWSGERHGLDTDGRKIADSWGDSVSQWEAKDRRDWAIGRCHEGKRKHSILMDQV